GGGGGPPPGGGSSFFGGGGGGGGGGWGGGGGAPPPPTAPPFFAAAAGGGGGGGSSFATPSGTGTTYTASTIGTPNNNGQVTISYTLVTPTLAITKTHTGNFTHGQQGTYTITVGNNGTGPTDGSTVTVNDTLPAGLTARSIAGTGWNCTLSTLTCTRSDVLAAGSSYPPITLKVKVSRDCDARRQVTNTATATGGGDTATHTAADPATIKRAEHCDHDEHCGREQHCDHDEHHHS
ncbi:hypothetical protein ACFV5K_01790, partial [Streptomyces sp. NPDC059744]